MRPNRVVNLKGVPLGGYYCNPLVGLNRGWVVGLSSTTQALSLLGHARVSVKLKLLYCSEFSVQGLELSSEMNVALYLAKRLSLISFGRRLKSFGMA